MEVFIIINQNGNSVINNYARPTVPDGCLLHVVSSSVKQRFRPKVPIHIHSLLSQTLPKLPNTPPLTVLPYVSTIPSLQQKKTLLPFNIPNRVLRPPRTLTTQLNLHLHSALIEPADGSSAGGGGPFQHLTLSFRLSFTLTLCRGSRLRLRGPRQSWRSRRSNLSSVAESSTPNLGLTSPRFLK
jgi:hypothetical protein